MTPKCRQTIKDIINHSEYDCTVETFKKSNRINWEAISYYKYLSEDFIREFQNEVNWFCISAYQKLSENFIRELKNKVDWWEISSSQKLSENFIREFKKEIDWERMLKLNPEIDINNFPDIFFVEFSGAIKNFGTPKQIDRLEKLENRTIDRTYDIIL